MAGALWDVYDSPNDRESPSALGDSISDGFDYGIWTALHKQPGRRFGSVGALEGALDSVGVSYDPWRATLLHRVFLDHGITPTNDLLVLTAVDATEQSGPLVQLLGSHPNPFNPMVRIRYVLRGRPTELVHIRIYDAQGRLLRAITPEQEAPGIHEVTWDGLNDSRLPVASGVYFCEMRCGRLRDHLRLVLAR